MTTDLCSDDVVVCITSPQILMSESIVTSAASGGGGAAGSRASSTATVELGRRLLLAARAGDTPLVLDLMARGAPFTTDWLGTSPLHLAAGNAHAETCAVLLRAGFSRDARTKVQRTPLHLAAYGGHARVARLLLEGGAAVDCRDLLRMTPLHWAVQRGHAAAAAELLRRGADPAALSKFRKTPLSLAAETRREDLLRLIEDCVKEREAARSVDALVNDQMANAPPAIEHPVQLLDTVQRIEQVKPRQFEKKSKVEITHTDSGSLKRDDLIKLIEDAMKDRGGQAEESEYTIVNEQISDPSVVDPQLQSFDTIHRIQEVKVNKQKQDRSMKMDAQVEGSGGSGASAAQLLRSHGITLLPADDGSTVLNALQSGRTVVLSDAGKLMLKESEQVKPGKGVVLTATPVKSPPRPGVKIFTLNNKLLLPRDGHKVPANKIINTQDMQVKFVHLPADAKIISPSKLLPMKAKSKPAARPAVKIIMNKANFNKLVANSTKVGVSQNGIETSPTITTTVTESSSPAPTGAESQPEAEHVVCVPEEFLRSSSPRYLRTQLVAAHRALAAAQAELRACRARLAHYEPV